MGWFERIALKHVYYHMWNRWQAQFDAWNRALKAGAMDNLEGWNREGSGRGFRMGNTLHPWLIHVSSVQSLSRVQLFVTPWTTACQASLSITNSWSPPKPMCIESVMPSSVIPFSSCLQSFLTSGSFPMSQLLASGGQSIGVAASKSVLPMKDSQMSLKMSLIDFISWAYKLLKAWCQRDF